MAERGLGTSVWLSQDQVVVLGVVGAVLLLLLTANVALCWMHHRLLTEDLRKARRVHNKKMSDVWVYQVHRPPPLSNPNPPPTDPDSQILRKLRRSYDNLQSAVEEGGEGGGGLGREESQVIEELEVTADLFLHDTPHGVNSRRSSLGHYDNDHRDDSSLTLPPVDVCVNRTRDHESWPDLAGNTDTDHHHHHYHHHPSTLSAYDNNNDDQDNGFNTDVCVDDREDTGKNWPALTDDGSNTSRHRHSAISAYENDGPGGGFNSQVPAEGTDDVTNKNLPVLAEDSHPPSTLPAYDNNDDHHHHHQGPGFDTHSHTEPSVEKGADVTAQRLLALTEHRRSNADSNRRSTISDYDNSDDCRSPSTVHSASSQQPGSPCSLPHDNDTDSVFRHDDLDVSAAKDGVAGEVHALDAVPPRPDLQVGAPGQVDEVDQVDEVGFSSVTLGDFDNQLPNMGRVGEKGRRREGQRRGSCYDNLALKPFPVAEFHNEAFHFAAAGTASVEVSDDLEL